MSSAESNRNLVKSMFEQLDTKESFQNIITKDNCLKELSNPSLNSLIKRCHNSYFNSVNEKSILNETNEENINTNQQKEEKTIRLIVKDKFRKVVSENDIHKLKESENLNLEIKRCRELEDLYQDIQGNTFIDDDKTFIPSFSLLKNNDKKTLNAEVEDNLLTNSSYNFLNDFEGACSTNINKFKYNNTSLTKERDQDDDKVFDDKPNFNGQNKSLNADDCNNLSLREDDALIYNNCLSQIDKSSHSFLLSFINNTLLSNNNSNKKDFLKFKCLSNEDKIKVLIKLYSNTNLDNNIADLENQETDTKAYGYLQRIMKLESLTTNINSEITNSGTIIKAYRSKLKSKNWNCYLLNSKLTELKNKYKFYHKCNFPSCNRTFSSSGWLSSHIEEHMREIHEDEFNKDFDNYAKLLKYII